MFKKILVSLDGTEPSEHALEVAIDIAKRYGAHLTIAHALLRDASIADLREVAAHCGFLDQVTEDLASAEVVPTVGAPGAGVPVVVIPDSTFERIGSLLLDDAASRARDQGLEEVESALLEDDPASAILDYGKTHGIEMMVIGSRGYGDFKSLLLGSVSHKLVEGCDCPCLVVK
jgi:nucleotide-binding universal stress UspA family protein